MPIVFFIAKEKKKKRLITDVTSVTGKEMQLVNWHTHRGLKKKTKKKNSDIKGH